MSFATARLPSPIGELKAVATEKGLAYLGTPRERPERYAAWAARRLAGAMSVDELPALALARDQIVAYFAGTLRSFDVPLDIEGTPFQRRVWDALLEIPFGRTATYADIAAEVGSPGADRAVGSANGANVVSIIVPCHRVVGSDGALTGYAGGMRTKAKLLKHERATCSTQARLF